MIKTRDDLQDCLDKDKRALGVKKSRPSIIGDEVWKFEIALRMDEFYRNAELKLNASPVDFLSLFKNASYVFTNSFHGTVFSLLYHKQFYSQVKLEGNKQNSRALNLLNQVGLIPENFDADAFSTDMNTDWKLVDSNIATMRREGLNYLLAITKSKGVE